VVTFFLESAQDLKNLHVLLTITSTHKIGNIGNFYSLALVNFVWKLPAS